MIDLQKLIIERITISKQITPNITAIIQKEVIKTMEGESQVNRAILKCISSIKSKQRERIRLQGEMLEDIKGLRFFNNSVIEQVYNVSRPIFYLYNQSLQSTVQYPNTTSEKLRVLYKTFFQQEHTKISSKHVINILSNQISQSTPFILLGWTCEWSRNLLYARLKEASHQEYIRHEQEMKRISNSYSRNSGDNAIKKSNQQSLVNPVSVSTAIPKIHENPLILTNKESVFGLFLDELSQYYRSFPLQLDLNFVKTMRKVFHKGNLFQNQQNLQKAVQILIQSKNKDIKDGQEQYRYQCQMYLLKNPNSLSQNWINRSLERSISKLGKSKKGKKRQFFERVKSESKEQHYKPLHQNNHDSFLLRPKANQISFESSKEISKSITREKDKRFIELPEIIKKTNYTNNNSNLYLRNKPTSSFSGQVNKSLISNYEKAIIKSIPIIANNFQFKNHPLSPPSTKNPILKILKNYSCEQSKNEQLGILFRRESQQFRENRKLMLQLLRQKNRNYIFEK